MSFQDPTPSDGFAPKIITVGGGKGGIGKSFLTASLGITLARRGSRVLAIDLDLGGANLHAWLGMPPVAEKDLGRFLLKGGPDLDELVQDGPVEGLSVIHGATTNLSAPNIKYAVKQKVLQRLRRLNYDWIIADLGAGTGYNTVDFFLLGTRGILTLTPERTSVENAYRFLRASVLRALRASAPKGAYSQTLQAAEADAFKVGNVEDLIDKMTEIDAASARVARATLNRMKVGMVVNQVWDLDELRLAEQIKIAAKRHLSLPVTFLGPVRYDESVMRALRKAPRPAEEALSLEGLRDDIAGLADRIIRDTEYSSVGLGSIS